MLWDDELSLLGGFQQAAKSINKSVKKKNAETKKKKHKNIETVITYSSSTKCLIASWIGNVSMLKENIEKLTNQYTDNDLQSCIHYLES